MFLVALHVELCDLSEFEKTEIWFGFGVGFSFKMASLRPVSFLTGAIATWLHFFFFGLWFVFFVLKPVEGLRSLRERAQAWA